LEQETKEKDKVIKDLITSYKVSFIREIFNKEQDLEDMVTKTARISSRSQTKHEVNLSFLLGNKLTF